MSPTQESLPKPQASPPAPLPKERVALGGDVLKSAHIYWVISNCMQ